MGWLAASALCGCGRERPAHIAGLVCETLPGEPRARVSAAVEGDTAGLTYRWSPPEQFKVSRTQIPEAEFRPLAAGVSQVSVEALRNGLPLAEPKATCFCEFTPNQFRPAHCHPAAPIEDGMQPPPVKSQPGVRITGEPLVDESGDPDFCTEIMGEVSGVPSDGSHYVAVYAWNPGIAHWRLQPVPGSRISFDARGAWRTWSRGGSRYAALILRRDSYPSAILETLPEPPAVLDRAVFPRPGRPAVARRGVRAPQPRN